MFDAYGLYLELAPAGGKWWRLSLGVYPEVSLKEARERRDDARRLLKDFIDPSEHRKELKRAKKAVAENAFGALPRVGPLAGGCSRSFTRDSGLSRTLTPDFDRVKRSHFGHLLEGPPR